MTTATATQELIEHANRLHQALYALGTSPSEALSTQRASEAYSQGPYDHVQEAFIQILAMLVSTRYRAEQLRMLMLDDSGEGVAYWLGQEAQAHQWEMDTAHEMALEELAYKRFTINSYTAGSKRTGFYTQWQVLDQVTHSVLAGPLDSEREAYELVAHALTP